MKKWFGANWPYLLIMVFGIAYFAFYGFHGNPAHGPGFTVSGR